MNNASSALAAKKSPLFGRIRLLSWMPPSFATYIYTVVFKPPVLRSFIQSVVRIFIPEKISIHGVELLLNPKDAIVSGSLALGCYESSLLSQFESFIKPGMCVLDIGANIGLYTVVGAKAVGPNGFLMAIEPATENCRFVERSLNLNGFTNVLLIQGAAGDENKTVSLFLCDHNFADHRIYDQTGARPATDVQMYRIDDIVANQVKRPVDVIKIDIQGAEAFAFAGMKNTLRSNPGIKVLMEFWPWGLESAGSRPAELIKEIRDLGFSIFEFSDRLKEFREVTDDVELASRRLERQHANLLLERR